MTRTLLILLLAAAATTPLTAEPVRTSRSVETADLDLSTAAGLRTLDHRLTIAIVDACGEASDVDMEGANAVRACRADARARVAAERDRIVALRAPQAAAVASR
jgi:UrcA family protein